MQENKQPELKSGYVVRTKDGWFNVFDKCGEMIFLQDDGCGLKVNGLKTIIEIRKWRNGFYQQNYYDGSKSITAPVWKKLETKQMTVAEVSKMAGCTVEIVEA